MARLARVEVFAADEVAVVHVMNRVVRRCFLLGDDPVTGKLRPPQGLDRGSSPAICRRVWH